MEPFLSTEHIQKGAGWFESIAKELDGTNFGILRLTKENPTAPWTGVQPPQRPERELLEELLELSRGISQQLSRKTEPVWLTALSGVPVQSGQGFTITSSQSPFTVTSSENPVAITGYTNAGFTNQPTGIIPGHAIYEGEERKE